MIIEGLGWRFPSLLTANALFVTLRILHVHTQTLAFVAALCMIVLNTSVYFTIKKVHPAESFRDEGTKRCSGLLWCIGKHLMKSSL